MICLERLLICVVVSVAASGSALSAEEAAGDPLAQLARERGAVERAGAEPLPANWSFFSTDEGKAIPADQLPAVTPGQKATVLARGVFTVEDPAKVGMIWVTTDSPVGGISDVDERQIGPRYVGLVPVLLNATVTVNGQEVAPELPGMLFRRWGIDPKLLKPGENKIMVAGAFWNSWSNLRQGHNATVGFKLMQSPADALDLRSGPVLGPIGADTFTFACRTHIPAEIKVTVRPTDPAGEPAAHAFPRGTIHKIRVPLPEGTRKFEYTVTAVNGEHEKVAGTWPVRVPGLGGPVRFVVIGQTATDSRYGDALARGGAAILKMDPDFIIHTGSIVKMAYWDFEWDEAFFEPLRDLLARVPMCIVPAYRDCYSVAYGDLMYHPTEDGGWNNWTWSCGPVRFLGYEGYGSAMQADAVAKWTEEVLQAAKEKYLFSVTAYPGFISRPFGRAAEAHTFDKTVLHPLLAKYHATAALGCTGGYEYVAPPEGEGVPSIIAGGVGAEMAPGWDKFNVCLFEIADGKCTMKVVAYETGEVLDEKEYQPRE